MRAHTIGVPLIAENYTKAGGALSDEPETCPADNGGKRY